MRRPWNSLRRFLSLPTRPRTIVRRPTRQRLRLESLEDRIVPTIVFEPYFGTEPTSFGGGQKLNATPVELIFWGSTYWNNVPAGAATASQIASAYSTLLGSPYYNHLGQYGAGGATNYLANWWIDTADGDPGSTVTDGQITQEIVNAINDPNAPIYPPSNFNGVVPLYVVVTPQGTAVDPNSIPMLGKVGYEGTVKGSGNTTPGTTDQASSHPTQGQGGSEGGVNGGVQTVLGYHFDVNASTNYGNYNLVYAWIGNYYILGLGGTFNNLDSESAIFSHESSEAMTDSQPFSGITCSAGASLPGGGNGEIGDFEPEDYNLEEYRVNGVLAQATWDYNYQAFVVSDGTAQNFYLYPQYQYNGGSSYTFLGNVLYVYGDQFGSNYNDNITLNTTGSGGLQVTMNGETVAFESGLDITTTYVYAGGGSNTINVLGTPFGMTTDIVSGGSDTVNVGGGNAQNILGDVNIENPPSFTNIVVNDSSDSFAHNITFNNIGANPIDSQGNSDSWGQISGLLGFGNINYEYGDTRNVTVQTGSGSNTVNVNATGGIGVTNIVSGGADTVNVGNGTLSGLGNTLNIESPPSFDNININDSSDSTLRTVTIQNIGANSSDSQGNSDPWGQVSGLGANINYEYGDTRNVTVQTGTAAGNTINVLATGGIGVTNIQANAGAAINVGSGGTVSGIGDTLNLENQPSFSTININDSADATVRTVSLSNIGANPNDLGGTSDAWGQVSGLGGAAINYEYADTNGLTLQTGNVAGNVINVLATGQVGPTNIQANATATVNVGSGGHVSGILGTLNIENVPTHNAININDGSDTTARTVTVSNIGANPADSQGSSDPWGQVSGLGGAAINFEYYDTTSVTVNGPAAGSTYNILGTSVVSSFTTIINAGAGSDTFNVGASNSLNGITGALTVNGGGGTNTLNANDSSSAGGQSYTLSSTQLGRSGIATITYSGMHTLNVTASGSDTLTIVAPAPTALVTFHGGSGTNTLVGANVANTWTISGANSGKVGNVTFDHFQNLTGGSSNDTFNFTASTASVSGVLNGGGGTGNKISYSTLGSSFLVNVTLTSNTAGTAPLLANPFVNINSVAGSTDTGNTLTAPGSTNTWTISGANAGNVNTGPSPVFSFTGMPHLVGGTGVDTFKFGSISGTELSINGGGAPAGQGNWLNYAAFGSATTVTVNLATNSATNVNGGVGGSISNIQNVLGSATGTNNLTGSAQGNILIGGTGHNTLVGGSGNSLLIGGGGAGHGSIAGHGNEDILIAGSVTYSAATTAGQNSLMAILAELQSSDTFADKVYDIIHGTNAGDPAPHGHDLNGANKLTWAGTVHASTGAYTLTRNPSATADWFFSQSPSTVSGFVNGTDEHNNNAIGVF